MVHSQFIYELTRHEGTSPIVAVVQTWIQKISEKLNIMIRYSERLYGVLVNRANYIRRKVKQCAGSVPKKRFLQLGWEFKNWNEAKLKLMLSVKTLNSLKPR